MLRESAVSSVALGVFVCAVGFGFDWPVDLTIRIALLAVGLPFLIAALMQYHVMRSHAQGKIENALGRAFVGVRDVSDRVPARDRDQVNVEQVRLIPARVGSGVTLSSELAAGGHGVRVVEAPAVRMLDNCDERDLVEFVEGLAVRGITRRGWIGFRFSSGRVCDTPYHDKLIAPLLKVNAVVGREARQSGKLVADADEIKRRLGLVGLVALAGVA